MEQKLAPGVTLVLGGARSGKSRFAELLVETSGLGPVYIATGTAFDAEMRNRIEAHRNRRGPAWRTIEAPIDLVGALRSEDLPASCILVDCLTLWVNNLMVANGDIETAGNELVHTLDELKQPAVLVANEVGLGIVPDNAMARRFRDEAGRLNQKIAAVAANVYFVAAGLPVVLKPSRN